MCDLIVLAMHGMTPKDFPKQEKREFRRLHTQIENAGGSADAVSRRRYDELDQKIRAWPRTKENDPYCFASNDLGVQLGRVTGKQVIVGFNEFCAPDLDDAIKQAAGFRPNRIIVVTPMMTRGGSHSETEIPALIERVKPLYPSIQILYVWPFQNADIAKFLSDQIDYFTHKSVSL